MDRIQAVITCVGFADFLAETLPHNRALFDRTVVVTAPEDKQTRRVCEYWHVECIATDVFESRWDRFNKGKGINVGIDALLKNGGESWLVHMDADVLLPPLTRKLLLGAQLDKTMVYGIDRFMVANWKAWREFIERPDLQQEGWGVYDESGMFVHPTRFKIGVRVMAPDGFVPIGFFQMWHTESGIMKYPEQHTDAGRGDMLFALQWPRSRRALIPEVIGYHLESEPVPMGSNWNGRKTKPFTQEAA